MSRTTWRALKGGHNRRHPQPVYMAVLSGVGPDDRPPAGQDVALPATPTCRRCPRAAWERREERSPTRRRNRLPRRSAFLGGLEGPRSAASCTRPRTFEERFLDGRAANYFHVDIEPACASASTRPAKGSRRLRLTPVRGPLPSAGAGVAPRGGTINGLVRAVLPRRRSIGRRGASRSCGSCPPQRPQPLCEQASQPDRLVVCLCSTERWWGDEAIREAEGPGWERETVRARPAIAGPSSSLRSAAVAINPACRAALPRSTRAFTNASPARQGATLVTVAGEPVGKVEDISLQPTDGQADIRMFESTTTSRRCVAATRAVRPVFPRRFPADLRAAASVPPAKRSRTAPRKRVRGTTP